VTGRQASAQARHPSRPGRLARLALLCLIGTAPSAWAQQGWITDAKGCKIANPNPRPTESVTWNGACVDGFADGQGVMQWYSDATPGPRYEGNLKRGVISGRGKLTLPDGSMYDGEWSDGKQQGTGTLTTPDGGSYQGEWRNGEPDGRGTMRDASGKTATGNWRQGRYIGPEDKDTDNNK